MKYKNRTFQLLLALYTFLLLAVSTAACYFSYTQKKEEFFSAVDVTFRELKEEYSNITDNFWQLYMPIFESNDKQYNLFVRYFSENEPLDPLDRQLLANAMQSILMRDSRVQWVALISDCRDINYIMFQSSPSLSTLSDDFPYWSELKNKPQTLEVYQMETISDGSSQYQTFALCGNSPKYMGNGKLIAGYSTSFFEQICQNTAVSANDLSFQLTFRDRVLFSSDGAYETSVHPADAQNFAGITSSDSGTSLYIRREICANRHSQLSYQVPWNTIAVRFHKNTPIILITVLIFMAGGVILYWFMLRSIDMEVSAIRHGLDRISANHLDYRISTTFHQDGLSEIADSINRMSARLEENINRMYFYELKQKEAELAELQSKFNPHFLYNSLEMIRSRCLQNEDLDTAEIISQLSAIFRGFISSKTFIPLTEELAFSRRYLSLFKARYEDQVHIRFDIETELLSYGIIRNLFQPLIENYFVHGFDSSAEDENCLFIRGRSLNAQTMLLTVEDNGCGMSDEELEKLNTSIHEPIQLSNEHYGLKNLHQRIRLFYGPGYGIMIRHNQPKGIKIELTVKKLPLS